uniref:Uncharacterized protein n=1 Tax=Glaucocystis incrassata TaxID=1789788 RepID=A0A3G1IVX7_9EUKA|nr:hypothetical protein [Glaucocystis incrassata]ASQ40089.1 hypothetical protein [Glaucocystis incrassata]
MQLLSNFAIIIKTNFKAAHEVIINNFENQITIFTRSGIEMAANIKEFNNTDVSFRLPLKKRFEKFFYLEEQIDLLRAEIAKRRYENFQVQKKKFRFFLKKE